MKHETEFSIPIPESSLKIYAKQYGELDKPVVIFVHGLTGHMDEHQFYNGARYFYEQGISSVRFNLYSFESDSRNLVDCTLETHAADLNLVMDFLRPKANKLFAVGHSYGGPTILLAKHSLLDAITFWDASFDYRFDDAKRLPGTPYHYLDWGVWSLVGDAMYQEALTFDQQKLFNNFNTPIKVITAEKSSYPERIKNYELSKGEKAYHQIKGAGHTFTEEGTAEELFEETLTWFKKFI